MQKNSKKFCLHMRTRTSIIGSVDLYSNPLNYVELKNSPDFVWTLPPETAFKFK